MLSFFKKKLEKIIRLPRKDLVPELEVALLEAGVSLEVVDSLIDSIRDSDDVKAAMRSTLLDMMKPARLELKGKPFKIMIVGINGSGKTTTIAKIAHLLLKKGKSVVVAGADTFRAAAIEQLQEHCDRLGIRLVKHRYGADPAAVAYDAVEHARAKGIDVVLIDTSGRLHVDEGLMRELKKIKRVIDPDLTLMVVDATTGNDAVEQARAFEELIDGFVMSKMDVDERGGAVISISAVTGKPIYFIGTGQDYEDLEEFDPEKIVKSLGI